MADTKVNEIKTRISLKYDTLASWNASTFKLLPGELAIVSLGTTVDGTTAGEVNQHPVLFKVGTGDHTFSQLPFASALAADVYAWAKASDVILEGKTIKFVGTDKTIPLNYITENEASSLINEALASYSTTDQMNAAIKVETDRAVAAEKALGLRIDNLNVPEGGFASASDLAELKEKVEDEDGALDRANEAYELANSKTTIEEVEGKGYAIASEVNSKLDKKANAETTYTKTEVDNLVAPLATTSALNNVKTTAEKGVADAADAMEAAQNAQDTIDNFLTGEGVDPNVIENLKEIQAALEETATAEEVVTELAKKADKTITIISDDGLTGGGDLSTNRTIGLSDTTKASLAKADTAVQEVTTGTTNGTISVDGNNIAVKGLGSAAYTASTAYATSAQGTKADNAATTIATYGDIVTHDASEFQKAGSYETAGTAQNLINGLDSSVTATAEANNQVSVLTGVTQSNGKLTAKTETKLAAIAKTGKVDDLLQDANTYVLLNCGTATTVI